SVPSGPREAPVEIEGNHSERFGASSSKAGATARAAHPGLQNACSALRAHRPRPESRRNRGLVARSMVYSASGWGAGTGVRAHRVGRPGMAKTSQCAQGSGRDLSAIPGAPPMSDVTRILSAIEQGDPHGAAQLLPLVYDELRRLAAQKLAGEKPGQT